MPRPSRDPFYYILAFVAVLLLSGYAAQRLRPPKHGVCDGVFDGDPSGGTAEFFLIFMCPLQAMDAMDNKDRRQTAAKPRQHP